MAKAQAKKKKPAVKTAAAKATAASVAELLAGDQKKVLHIGCGVYNAQKLHVSFRKPEWKEIRVDIDSAVKPDVVSDMLDMHMFGDNSVDAVWSSHNIEHLYAHQVPLAFAEFFRVIRPGGFLLITLPDMQTVATYVALGKLEQPLYKSPAGPISPLDIIYGFGSAIAKGNTFMAHRTAFTGETLGKKMLMAGFCNVTVKREEYDLWGLGYKLPKNHAGRKDLYSVSSERALPAGQLPSASGAPDELVRPPVMWEPLKLKDGK